MSFDRSKRGALLKTLFPGWRKRLQQPLFLAAYILLSTLIALFLGMLAGQILLPFVQAAAIFPVFWILVTTGNWRRAVGAILAWAALTASIVIFASMRIESFLEPRILLGESYRQEMFHWILTGDGPEGDIRRFLPQHLLHLLLFSTLTVLSGGFLGLVMGAALMNYMSFYVGALLSRADDFVSVLLLAWPPWAAIRVLAYVTIATALSALTWDRQRLGSAEPGRVGRYLFLGAALLLLDLVLKWQLAPVWQQWLNRFTDLG